MRQTHTQSISWFTVIGIIAAAVHYMIAVGLEWSYLLPPTQANIIGFLTAFPVSYFGHRKLSFSSQSATHKQAFPRFLAVAVAGFIANQSLVIGALRFTQLPFWLVLGFVMVVIAVSTYLLSRYWAFKGVL
ncbi:MAG: GtrA family protein [Methylotenera sp.]|nr:GtrA family protein [Methylotenera sp.]MDO9234093.1 GtrA family protein [Methylotenera sp.]MDO9388328.1 GtrA family protein [Methylotenera sp.]MDP2101666.1 GtrA family protein [Methylotenera sp.]MDP2280854.1 GtrA family protein [Methylotenera sp.]